MSIQSVTVIGMTCGHCATSVREEVGGLPGVRTVEVDLASGQVTIDSESGLDPAAISDAVAEAGYAVAS